MKVILFKPTENCNSNCVYCDGVAKAHRKDMMTLDLVETVFFRINEYLIANPEEEIQFTWHGGEPLLMGIGFFRQTLDIQRRICQTTSRRIHHSIQSNLTLLNQDFIDVFCELGITGVGSSYDPIPQIRGIGKKVDSAAYNHLFWRAIELLERNNFSWGFIYVVTRRSLADPDKIFNYLSNMRLCGGFNINAVLVYGADSYQIAITPQEYADFLGAIFPRWWRYRSRYPQMDPFSSLEKNLTGQGLSLGCCDSGTCAYSHVYIGPDGNTSQCGRSADWDIVWYGNIRDHTLTEIIYHEKRKALVDRNQLLQTSECKGCTLWFLCHGGCPLDSFPEHRNFNHKSPWCLAKKMFVEKYFEPITGITIEQGAKEHGH